MNREEFMEKYKGWVIRGGTNKYRGVDEINFKVDDEGADKDQLHFLAYDANLWPLPDASRWEKNWLEENISFLLGVVRDFDGEVWLDDLKIKVVWDE